MTGAPHDSEPRDLFGIATAPARKGRQLPLPLGWRRDATDTAPLIVIGDSNAEAVRHIVDHAHWTMPASILIGPPQSGRSLIGRAFLESGGTELIDDLEHADAEAVFHSWNRMQASGGRMLIVAGSRDAIAAVALPDLKTRLATAPLLTIEAPDVCLTRDLVEHLLVERGLNPSPQLGSYVAARIERSYPAIHAAVAAIDARVMATGGIAGIRGARAALIDACLYDGNGRDSDSMEPE